MADWAKIKAEYIRGGISTRKLAEKHGVPYATLKKKCMDESWVKLKEQRESKAAAAVVDACATKEAEKAIRIYEIADIAMEVILSKLMYEHLNSQDVRSLTGALKDIAAVKGIQTDAERREQEARIAKLRREAEVDSENRDVRVQIVGVSQEELSGILT